MTNPHSHDTNDANASAHDANDTSAHDTSAHDTNANPSKLIVENVRAVGRRGLGLGPISFSVDVGAHLAVVGEAGAGKSLLLAVIAGIARLVSGSITKPARVSMVFQRDALDDARTALDNVAVAARARAVDNALDAAKTALARVGLADAFDKLPRQLSGGMKKRVGIARALVVQPELLLADDPTAGLDPETAREVLALLFDTADAKRITLIATQDVDVVLPRVANVLALDRGASMYLGGPDAIAYDEIARAFAATKSAFEVRA